MLLPIHTHTRTNRERNVKRKRKKERERERKEDSSPPYFVVVRVFVLVDDGAVADAELLVVVERAGTAGRVWLFVAADVSDPEAVLREGTVVRCTELGAVVPDTDERLGPLPEGGRAPPADDDGGARDGAAAGGAVEEVWPAVAEDDFVVDVTAAADVNALLEASFCAVSAPLRRADPVEVPLRTGTRRREAAISAYSFSRYSCSVKRVSSGREMVIGSGAASSSCGRWKAAT